MPTLGNLCPVALLGSALLRKLIECFFDVRKWDANPLGCTNEGDTSKHIPVETSLVPFISRTEDETFAFVEMESGHCDAASICHLSD